MLFGMLGAGVRGCGGVTMAGLVRPYMGGYTMWVALCPVTV